MLRIIIGIFAISQQLRLIEAECSKEIDSQALFMREHGDTYIFAKFNDRRLSMQEGETMAVFCAAGFREQWDPVHSTFRHFECRNQQFQTYNGYVSDYVGCSDNNPVFYHANITNCPYDGYYYGYLIEDEPIIFAEFCINLDKMETIFINYVESERSPVFDRQTFYNPTSLNVSITKHLVARFNDITPHLQEFLDAHIKKNLQNYADVFTYEFSEFAPIKKFAASVGLALNKLHLLNIFPWWKPLKNVTWSNFQSLLAAEGDKNPLHVYVGQSHVVTYPSHGKCDVPEDIKYELDSFYRNVPLYIWNYIKPRNGEGKEVVVIGVNSPFFTPSDRAQVLCDDICDTIDWLKPLNKTRRFPAFGYVYCCKPESVKHVLKGFPETEE